MTLPCKLTTAQCIVLLLLQCTNDDMYLYVCLHVYIHHIFFSIQYYYYDGCVMHIIIIIVNTVVQ